MNPHSDKILSGGDVDGTRVSALPSDQDAPPSQLSEKWRAGHDGMGKFGIYHGEETKKGWSGKGTLLVDSLSKNQAEAIVMEHNKILSHRRRCKMKISLPVPVLASPDCDASQEGEARESTREKADVSDATTAGTSRGGQRNFLIGDK